jgi:hypothetical protein
VHKITVDNKRQNKAIQTYLLKQHVNSKSRNSNCKQGYILLKVVSWISYWATASL